MEQSRTVRREIPARRESRIRRTTLIRTALARQDASHMALRWIAYAAGTEVGERGSKPRDPDVSAETNALAAQAADEMIAAILEADRMGSLRRCT